MVSISTKSESPSVENIENKGLNKPNKGLSN